jgi:acylphosphatase
MTALDAPAETRKLNLLVEGHVQGVGFRFAAVEIASQFAVAGFVRNLPDGNVEVVAEGTESAVSDFWTALRQSRAYRHVTREHVAWSPGRGGFMDFSILYS